MLYNITKSYGKNVYVVKSQNIAYQLAEHNPALCCGAIVVGNEQLFNTFNQGYTFLESNEPIDIKSTEEYDIKNILLDDGSYLCVKINKNQAVPMNDEDEEDDF